MSSNNNKEYANSSTNTEDVDPFISFQELISDALNSTTDASTTMIRVMAEVFTQQQQILNLQIETQEMIKENREILKKITESQKFLSQQCQRKLVSPPPPPEKEVVIPIPIRKIKAESVPPPKRRRERTVGPTVPPPPPPPPPKKRRFCDGPLWAQLSALLEALINYKDSEGRHVAADFIQLPSRRELPDYYKLISQPIDFSQLRRNLKRGHYDTIEALGNDIKLLVSNCQSFNREDSEIFRDSETLLAIWERLQASATALI